MKKIQKILYFILVFIFFILIQTTVEAGNTTVEALKSKFPAGKFWNHYAGHDHNYWNLYEDSGSCNNPDGWTNEQCLFHNGTTAGFGQPDCNSFDGGQQCLGFARKLFYDYYGQRATALTKIEWPSVSQVKPGDVIRYHGDGAADGGHEVWVIGVDNDHLIVGECNFYKPCEISWDRWVNKNNISIEYLFSAPYEINDNQPEPPEETFKPSGSIQNLGDNFIAQIVPKSATSYAVEAVENKNGANVYLQSRNNSSDTQKWRFERESDATYAIINCKTGLGMDVYGSGNENSENVQLWGFGHGDKQCWYIYSYNGAYRLVPRSSKTDLRALDVTDGKFTAGKNIAIYEALKNDNAAQTFLIEKYVDKITLNQTTATFKIGGVKTLTATIAPTDAASKSVTWSSSNTKVATVSSSGKVTAVGVGTAKITAKAKDGSNKSATCTVTVIPTLSINKERNTLNKIGETYKLQASVDANSAASFTWKSSNTKVATVNSSGLVTAKSGGFTRITATNSTYGSVSALIYVSLPVRLSTGKAAYAGDLDKNGGINSLDAALVYDIIRKGPTKDDILIADINGDGKVTNEDADEINNIYLYGGISIKENLPFTDVKTSDWYYNNVKYVYKEGIILGTQDAKFEPTKNLTRGELVTILHRMEGAPYVSGTSKFSDVQDTKSYYYVAVKWATKNNIVSGYNNGKFGPNDPITREQIAVMLNKYCRYKGKYKTQTASLSKFPDVNKVSNFAKWEMQWAVGTGIISGKTQGATKILDPQGVVSRAQAAAMFEKYSKNV